MNLLQSYIKNYLIKEQINTEDHDLIEEKMRELDLNLSTKSPSMNLDTLEFNPKIIASLRDIQPLKDIGVDRTKPQSLMNRRRFKSKSLNKFIGRTKPGLGFNAIEKLNSDSPYYTQKIEELISVYENIDPVRWKDIIENLKNCLNLKKAISETGLNVLGAGLYRVVVSIPEADNFVIKIGLGQKGRNDCKKEIEFSDGKGSSRLSHQKNFPTIYSRGANKNWYAVEKAVFFSDKLFGFNTSPEDTRKKIEIKDDIEEQFIHTMTFLDDVLKEFKLKNSSYQYNTKWKIFQKYLQVLFKKDETYTNTHEEYATLRSQMPPKKSKNIAQIVDPNKTLINVEKFNTDIKDVTVESVIRRILENSSPEKIISDSIFKQKIEAFIKDISLASFSFSFNNPNANQEIIVATDIISDRYLTDDYLQKMSKEISSMFDQAVVTNIRDLHTGNMGFKKNDEDKWQLIFTDIDTK